MSTEAEKPKTVSHSTALTERLRRAATVSDAGPLDKTEPSDERDKSDHDVILELNQAIQEIIAETPLRPSTAATGPQQSVPVNPAMQQQPYVPNGEAPMQDTRYLVAGPGGTLHSGTPTTQYQPPDQTTYHPRQTGVPAGYLPAPGSQPHNGYDDEGDLQQWLARPSDEQPEPRSRTRVVALCTGTMVLSILAGYGSAQMLNGYRADDAAGSTAVITTAADTNSDAATDDPEGDGDGVKRLVKRVRTLPVSPETGVTSSRNSETSDMPLRQPYRVASISDFGGTIPEPAPAQRKSTIPADGQDQDGSSAVAPELPPTGTQKPTPASISEADQERLFKRAHDLIDQRDIAAARLVLRHLAEAGSGSAARELAQTYDSEWLSANGAADVPANDDMALRWYSMALERGELGFEARIEALSETVRASN